VVWETVPMASVPKVGDAVVRNGSLVTYLVKSVKVSRKTVELERSKGGSEFLPDVPWSELSFLAKQRGYPDRRGMGAESDVIAEKFVPNEKYKAHQRTMAQTLMAAGLNSEQIASMLLVPVDLPSDKKPETKKPRVEKPHDQ
jgi:hypothetical protein